MRTLHAGGALSVLARSAATKQSRATRAMLDCFVSFAMTGADEETAR